jgi:putative transcriptional regulator
MRNRIKELRKKKGMTQEDLANAVGVSHWWISHIETGTRTCSLRLMSRIAKALDTTLDQIFLESDGQND